MFETNAVLPSVRLRVTKSDVKVAALYLEGAESAVDHGVKLSSVRNVLVGAIGVAWPVTVLTWYSSGEITGFSVLPSIPSKVAYRLPLTVKRASSRKSFGLIVNSGAAGMPV